jgi:uncharacterized membrane protein YjgN (DUF898 family)
MLTNPGKTRSLAQRATSHVTRQGLLEAGLFIVPMAAIIGFAIYDAAADDVVQVRQILNDPSAVHIPQIAPRS